MTTDFERRPDWLAAFRLPTEHVAGAVLAFDFDQDRGLWAARVDRYLMPERVVREPRITGSVLDVRTATFLRDHEMVAGATEPEGFAELVDLVRRAREKLIERHSVLLMGDEHLRLVTVTLDAVMSATTPEVNRAHGMIVELAGKEPVAAVLLGPGHEQWPGMWESLTERGYSMLVPGDPFPATYAGDERTTNVLDPVEERRVVRAWEGETEAVPAAVGLHDARHRRRGRARRTQVFAAAAALVLIASGGLAVALTVDDSPATTNVAQTSDAMVTETKTTTPPTTAAAADIKAARAPMSRYQAPPPPPKSTPKTTASPAPQPKPRPRKHRRTIPNPIPGLPPIVIG